MSAGFCLHCGLRLVDELTGKPIDDENGIHTHCAEAAWAEQQAKAKRPRTSMEQQLDRIEGLLMAIRDRFSL